MAILPHGKGGTIQRDIECLKDALYEAPLDLVCNEVIDIREYARSPPPLP
jgi:hypothetical protein